MIIAMNRSKYFWGETILTATYLINRMSSRVLLFKTPCQTLLHSYSNVRIVSNIPIKIFRCTTFIHIISPTLEKIRPLINKVHLSTLLTPKKLQVLFLNYQKNFTLMDVTFFESKPYYHKTEMQGETS